MKKLGLGVVALGLSACATTQHPPATPALATPAVPPGMQYLYGSGEASAISMQAWRALVRHAGDQVRNRPVDSVVLDKGSTLERPRFVPCGDKPFAAVFDVDETVLLNLGFEADDAAHPGRAYSDARWQDWEKNGATQVSPTPGAQKALAALRGMGITVVFNTNRAAANAAATEAALNGAGLGPAVHGETLYLKGDDNSGSLKDARRWRIADRYCVIAMGGDQLGDFSDLFNANLPPRPRREAVSVASISARWGAGWFVLPNPVYGTGLKGTLDEVFPADKRWLPQAK